MGYSIRKILGENVRKYRKSKGYSQEKFAELIEIGVTSLSLIETGKGFVTAPTLEKISDILQIPIAELMSEPIQKDSKYLYDNIQEKLQFLKNDTNKLNLIHEYIKLLI